MMNNAPLHPKLWIGICLVALGALAVSVRGHLYAAFGANPFFNGLILMVLIIGIAHSLRQLIRVDRETQSLSALKTGRRTPNSRLSRGLLEAVDLWTRDPQGKKQLSALAQKNLIDNVSLRLEEARDLLRYLSGLSIFLGLLGTFWGLLITIGAVTDIIGTLRLEGDAISMFSALKEQIKVPLSGMATSFSTSLFGLSVSLVIGFLDLQTGQAQNHFLLDLERWLMERGEDPLINPIQSGPRPAPAYIEALLCQTNEALDRFERNFMLNEQTRRETGETHLELQRQLQRLEAAILGQSRELSTLNKLLEVLPGSLAPLETLRRQGFPMPEEFRSELRLLTKTLALSLESASSRQSS